MTTEERLYRILTLLELHDKALRLMAGKLERIELMVIEIKSQTKRRGEDHSVFGEDQEP